MKIAPVYSSSAGNMYLIHEGEDAIIVDVGVAGSNIFNQSYRFLTDLSLIKGVFITHGHKDHFSGVFFFLEKYEKEMARLGLSPQLKVYVQAETYDEIEDSEDKSDRIYMIHQREKLEKYLTDHEELEEYEDEYQERLSARLKELRKEKDENKQYRASWYQKYFSIMGEEITLGNLHISAHQVSHDKTCHAFKVTAGEEQVAVCVDLGTWDKPLLEQLSGVQLILLEANYNRDKLMKHQGLNKETKRRILSPRGHLSNEDSVKFAKELEKSGLKTVIFGHMSSDNNNINLLTQAVTDILGENHTLQVDFAPGNGETGDVWYEVASGEKFFHDADNDTNSG